MSIYIVDYENVHADGIEKIEKLSEKDIVIIFYSIHQPNIAIDVVKNIQKSKATVVFKEANVIIEETNKSFHDALDMQLATYVGYIMGKHQDKITQYYIVSKDQGFSFICKYWCNRGFKVSQIKSIPEAITNIANEKYLEYEKEAMDLFEDKNLAKSIAKIIRSYKTKSGIHNNLQKKYGQKGPEYFKTIKPLIKDKK